MATQRQAHNARTPSRRLLVEGVKISMCLQRSSVEAGKLNILRAPLFGVDRCG
jgi:hypothetical protein